MVNELRIIRRLSAVGLFLSIAVVLIFALSACGRAKWQDVVGAPADADKSAKGQTANAGAPGASLTFPGQTFPGGQGLNGNAADRYLMIQNIATGKLRIYALSPVATSPNTLVFQTDMITGEIAPEKTRRAALGHYKIEKWLKFYQDVNSLFPSWYDDRSPSLPLPGASLQDWSQQHFIPANLQGRGLVRGAFGWYTAKIGPNAFAQWTHGTLGWGADRDRFIKIDRHELAEFYADPRGFGCTRIENQAIAFLQDILPVGTQVLKVYARESLADKTLARYSSVKPQAWEWLLSKDDVRKESPNSSSRPAQILRDVPESSILEQGTLLIDGRPVAAEGNLYQLPDSSIRGEFLVDEGRLVNYQHPRELRVGGFQNRK